MNPSVQLVLRFPTHILISERVPENTLRIIVELDLWASLFGVDDGTLTTCVVRMETECSKR